MGWLLLWRISWDAVGTVQSLGWLPAHPQPLQHILPMKSWLSARFYWDIHNLGGSVFVCFSPPAAQTPQEKQIKREGRESQTVFLRPQNFSDIHFKVFIAAFHPPPRVLGLNSLPGNRWDANLFLASCLL